MTLRSDMTIAPGTYKVIRVDGTEILREEKPTIAKVQRDIGCESLDTVLLDRRRAIVMLVDDTGMVDGKPVNPKATKLYHARIPTPYSIHGDVAVCWDGDFA